MTDVFLLQMPAVQGFADFLVVGLDKLVDTKLGGRPKSNTSKPMWCQKKLQNDEPMLFVYRIKNYRDYRVVWTHIEYYDTSIEIQAVLYCFGHKIMHSSTFYDAEIDVGCSIWILIKVTN